MQNNLDNTAISKLAVTFCLIIGAVFLAGQGVRTGNYMMMALVFAIPLGIYFLNKPEWILVWLFLVRAGTLLVPGLRGFSVPELFMIMAIGWWIASGALNRDKPRRFEKSELMLSFFMLNIILIMSIRGFGIALLGGYDLGGSAYISMLLVFFAYFALSRIELSSKHLKWIIFGQLLFSLVPIAAQVMVWISGGGLEPLIAQFVAIRTDLRTIETAEFADIRWGTLRRFAGAFFTIGLVLRFSKGRGKYMIPILMVGTSIILMMLTGFRSVLFGMVVQTMLWCIFMSKKRLATAALISLMALGGWLFIVLTIDFFPDNMARSVSFLPFVEVDHHVAFNAQHSVDFRVDIWRHALANARDYLWVGRGLVIDVRDWAFLQRSAYGTTDFFYFMRNYHSGPLSLLVDTGLPGLIFGTLFFILVLIEALRGFKDFDDKSSLAYRFYFLLVIQAFYGVFSFYFVYGDLGSAFEGRLLNYALLRAVRYSFGTRNKVSAPQPLQSATAR